MVDERPHRQRHERAPAHNGGPGDLQEVLGRQALNDHFGSIGKGREGDEARWGTEASRRLPRPGFIAHRGSNEHQPWHVPGINATRHWQPNCSKTGDRKFYWSLTRVHLTPLPSSMHDVGISASPTAVAVAL